MKPIQYTVTHEESRIILSDFLAGRLQISKKKAKDLLNTQNVFVNRHRIWMTRHLLKRGDKVEILKSENASKSATRFTILFEDDDYLIINKGTGLLSNGMNSVEDRLRDHLEMPFLTAVHRLDRDTSGCLLLAKNEPALKSMLTIFRKRRIRKTYHVIASGRLQPPAQTITTPMEGQRAITRIRTLDSNRAASHLLVSLQTSRTHQIRKHLDSIHHPVLGDRQYGTASRLTGKSLNIGRQMLHASEMEFDHPGTGRKIRAKASLPRDFRNCLKQFRLT